MIMKVKKWQRVRIKKSGKWESVRMMKVRVGSRELGGNMFSTASE